MKIVADENIARVEDFFSPWGNVVTLPGRAISTADIVDADVLLVRSVTRVNKALLGASKVKFVGTATIGVDHIDQDYLRRQNIALAAAPGCNAGAVVQYVFSVLANIAPAWREAEIGIIGCGNVGGRLDRQLHDLGVKTRCYDPLLPKQANPRLTDLESVLAADIICLHTPLSRTGSHPTWHLLDQTKLGKLQRGAVLINAGRGEVVDNRALSEAIDVLQLRVALDVWEGEPDISLPLLRKVALATPHIAGYSLDGKLAGTRMIHRAFCSWAGLTDNREIEDETTVEVIEGDTLNKAILQAYDVATDDAEMRRKLAAAEDKVSAAFDQLRKHYPQRREFSHFQVLGAGSEKLRQDLVQLGFTCR